MLWEEDDDACGVDDDSLTLSIHFCTPLVWGHPSSCAIAWDDAANTSLGFPHRAPHRLLPSPPLPRSQGKAVL